MWAERVLGARDLREAVESLVKPALARYARFLRDEIAAPLELSADFFIGTPEADQFLKGEYRAGWALPSPVLPDNNYPARESI